MRFITNDDVRRLATMLDVLEAVEVSTCRLADGHLIEWENTSRAVEAPDSEQQTRYNLRLAPLVDVIDHIAVLRILSFVGQTIEGGGAAHQVTVPVDPTVTGDNIAKPGPPHTSERSGWLHLFDIRTGRLLAVFQERDIQVMRVGAVGGLTAKYLATAEARTMGIIGSGWMARSQLAAHCLIRPIERVRVHSLNAHSRETFSHEMSRQHGIQVEAVESAEAAVRDADIVVTATSATRPVLDPSWLRPGAHVHSVSGADYDRRMVERADLIAWTAPGVGENESSRHGLGMTAQEADAIKAEARQRGTAAGYRAAGWALLSEFAEKRVYLSDLIKGLGPGRTSETQITFSPSPAAGSASMPRFAVLLNRLYQSAEVNGVGYVLPDDWFTQEARAYPTYRLR